jgi:citrate lyase subunit beta/citryl-CoA lyase
MKNIRPRRSALYTPGDKPAVLLKALKSAADVLIFDLEDAVAPDGKAAAREAVAQVLRDSDLGEREIVVRVNALGTAWCEDDVRAVARSGACAILFPKIGSEEDVAAAEALMSACEVPQDTELWCMVETPVAILNALTIARAAGHSRSRMTTWVMGTNDLVKELRGRHMPSREPLLPYLAIAVAAARAFGIGILDGVHNDIQDVDGLERTCLQGRAMGFDGRTLIHPSQIAPCHQAYTPAQNEVQEARAILEAFARPENQGKGVIKLDGRMVELLHAEMARQTVAIADAIAKSGRP